MIKNRLAGTARCINWRFIYPLIIVAFVFAVPARSQVLGNWTFNNLLSGTPGSFNTISLADFSSSIPSRAFNGGTEYFGENGWPSGGINSSMYFQFIIIPLPGHQLDISSIVLRIRRSNTGSPAGAGPTSWALRSSIDGFTSDISSGAMTYNYANYTVTTGSSFLGIYLPVTFRLYGYNATVNPGGSSRLVIDNISANGMGYLLPLKLDAFAAAVVDNRVNISWNCLHTDEGSRYSVERSVDGSHFNVVQQITETVAADEKKYSYVDDISQLSSRKIYYRLGVVNSADVPSYSAILSVDNRSAGGAINSFVYQHQLHISGWCSENTNYTIRLSTLHGQLIKQTTLHATAGYNSWSISLAVSSANLCVVHVSGSNGYSFSTLQANQ